MYTINVSLGTPPKYALFYIDDASIYNFVFTTGGNYTDITPDEFYNSSLSTTNTYLEPSLPKPQYTNGLTMNGPTE
jgi:hypothetical protein